MEQVGEELGFVEAPAGRGSRVWSVGRFAAQWVAYFTVSFALTAGVLLLARI